MLQEEHRPAGGAQPSGEAMPFVSCSNVRAKLVDIVATIIREHLDSESSGSVTRSTCQHDSAHGQLALHMLLSVHSVMVLKCRTHRPGYVGGLIRHGPGFRSANTARVTAAGWPGGRQAAGSSCRNRNRRPSR